MWPGAFTRGIRQEIVDGLLDAPPVLFLTRQKKQQLRSNSNLFRLTSVSTCLPLAFFPNSKNNGKRAPDPQKSAAFSPRFIGPQIDVHMLSHAGELREMLQVVALQSCDVPPGAASRGGLEYMHQVLLDSFHPRNFGF